MTVTQFHLIQTRLLRLTAGCILIFILLALALVTGRSLADFDIATINHVARYVTPQLTIAALIITSLGSSTAITAAMLAGALTAAFKRNFQLGILFLSTGLGSGILVSTLKLVFHRLRPAMLNPIHHALGFSFPSGHATSAAAVYGLYLIITLVFIKPKRLKLILCSFLAITILSIALSRVYLGVHYPSDILAGLCLGSAWACLCFSIYLESKQHRQQQPEITEAMR